MLHVETLPLGAYQTNCYLVWRDNSRTCVVIDPGYSPEWVLQKAAGMGKTIEAVLLTHGHFDHVGGVETIVKQTGCALWMHESDWSQAKNMTTAQLYPLANCDFCEVSFFEEGESLSLAGTDFRVYETAGHTWGSVCFAAEDALFTGDTLFAGSCGRTDLPGGDWGTIRQSLARLAELEGNYMVYPGHGEATSLDAERKHNPFLRG